MILSNKHIFIYFSLLLYLLISGCSMPKVVILNDPLTAEEHLQLGLSYEKKGLLEEAIKHYEDASKSDARGFLFMGNLYLNQNKFNEAEENYRKAIKKDGNLADAYNNLAWLYCQKGIKLEEAEELVKKAIEIEIKNFDKVKIYQNTLREINEKRRSQNGKY